jgi:hypothetical protein
MHHANGPKAKKSGWPRSRQCHEHSSRYDQAWNQFKALVFNEFGETKDLPIGHFTCLQPACSGVVRVDSRGFAACEICGYIYNDGPKVKKETVSKLAGEVRRAKMVRACKA